MKKLLFTSLLASIACAGTADAQLKVTSATGKIKMGMEPPAGFSGHDPLNALRVHVFGPNTDYRAGAKIGIGDFGSYPSGGWNVFIGEYGEEDSDQLWLNGKRGTYFTYGGRADNIYGYYDVDAGNIFHYNCDVYSYGIALSSDARFKTNVKNIGNALEQLKQLRGVSYSLLPHVLDKANRSGSKSAAANTAAGSMTEKEKKDQAFFDKLEQQKNKPGEKRLGLIAQEVQEVFPELVKHDSSNYLYVDYIGLIPVMIESIKEQEAIIDGQQAKIKELNDRLEAIERKLAGNDGSLGLPDVQKTGNSYLYQNTPNPFNAQTEIGYYLAAGTQTAVINIFDLQGHMIKSFPLKGSGKGQITINGPELSPGMYLYNLVVNGREADIKRMTLIK